VVRGHKLRIVPHVSGGSANLVTYNRDETAVYLSNRRKRLRKLILRSAQWKFARRSRLEMTAQYLRQSQFAAKCSSYD
jgi:hypothetical protein